MNFQHISNEDDERIVAVEARDLLSDPGENEVGRVERAKSLIPPGVYQDVKELTSVLNNLSNVKGHLEFSSDPGGDVRVTLTCNSKCCFNHVLELSRKIN